MSSISIHPQFLPVLDQINSYKGWGDSVTSKRKFETGGVLPNVDRMAAKETPVKVIAQPVIVLDDIIDALNSRNAVNSIIEGI